MAISSKTRKILWARSGNRCAICRRELVVEATTDDPAAIVGDECHIISKRSTGPRGVLGVEYHAELDSYDNLILLCTIHHRLVDEQINRFSTERLRGIKAAHEQWVRETLGVEGAEQRSKRDSPALNGITLLPRISSGGQLVNIVRGAHLYRFDNDELESQEEMELVSNFIQELHDWGDILDEVGAGESVRVGCMLGQQIKELECRGLLVFGERQYERMNITGMVDDWAVAVILVLREGNPAIIDSLEEEAG
jgi:hypothetical protein